MKITENLRLHAFEEAVQSYEEIVQACTRPDLSIAGNSLDIYRELVDWGFTERYPLTDPNNKWLYVVLIAMHLFKDTPKSSVSYSNIKQEQKGKWQIIQMALEKASKEKAKLEQEDKEGKRSKKKT